MELGAILQGNAKRGGVMDKQKLQLLSDDQVQRFIADGFVIIDSKLEASFHQKVTEQIAYALEYELPHPGDNIVPRVPALNKLCECPAVQGALRSLLGDRFVFLPHRFPHNSDPLAANAATTSSGASLEQEAGDVRQISAFESQPTMAEGSISFSGWHQDSHAGCGRTRWHTLRAANVFYFPHATPLHMGPTRFLAGSHLYATLHDLRMEQAVMQEIPAGSVVIAHFDLAHAGSPNNSDLGRYMMKFVALRTENPTKATWNNRDQNWRTPSNLHTHHNLPAVWQSLWNWMLGGGRGGTNDAEPSKSEIAAMINGMKNPDQQERLSYLYRLAGIGAPAVQHLVADLLSNAGKQRHSNPSGKSLSVSKAHHLDRFFLEGQFTPEDSAIALSAIGRPAVSALIELLDHADPWIRINAIYALGDAGPVIVGDHVNRMAELLNDPEPEVIRVALDALAVLGSFDAVAIERMNNLLAGDMPGWGTDVNTERRLSMFEQMRYLSAIALLSWVSRAASQPQHLVAKVETALLQALNDENGYPPLIACIALERSDSVSSLRAAVQYLRGRCWDTAQNSRPIGAWTIAHGRATLARLAALEKFKM